MRVGLTQPSAVDAEDASSGRLFFSLMARLEQKEHRSTVSKASVKLKKTYLILVIYKIKFHSI